MQDGGGLHRQKRAERRCNKLDFGFAVFLFFFGESIEILVSRLRIVIARVEIEKRLRSNSV